MEPTEEQIAAFYEDLLPETRFEEVYAEMFIAFWVRGEVWPPDRTNS